MNGSTHPGSASPLEPRRSVATDGTGQASWRPPSQADVAQMVGVSQQTVSRVCNNSPAVDDDTRGKVLEAMRELGYQPNAAARALVTGRFGAIGVIASSVTRNGDVQTLNALAMALRKTGRSINFALVEQPSAIDYGDAINALTGQSVDGVVIVQAEVLDTPMLSLPPGLPVVISDDIDGDVYPSVAMDQAPGARAMMEHLLGLNRGPVWHLAGPEGSYSAGIREREWRSALMRHGSEPPPLVRGDWSARSGYEQGKALSKQLRGGSIFCANDQMALGLMHALHEAGLSIPGEVAVGGFDDIPEAADFWPPLTTVTQDYAAVGRLCIELLLTQIDGRHPSPSPRWRVPVRLVLRESTRVQSEARRLTT